jgi:hypothetical protein
VLVLVATRHGPGVSPDSVSYLAAARNLAHGRGLIDFDGSELTVWPAGYPALLAGVNALGVSATAAARAVNACALAATVLLTCVLLCRHVASYGALLFGTAAVAVAPALVRTGDMVWSEPTFTVLVLAFVLLVEKAAARPSVGRLAVSGLVVSVAVLVRYLGFALVVAGVIALVVGACSSPTGWRRPGRAALGAAAQFVAWALVGPLVWAVRNRAEDLPAFGTHTDPRRGIGSAARDVLVGTGRLFVPDGVPEGVAVLVALAVAALVVGALVVVVRQPSARSMTTVTVTVVCVVGAAFASRVTTETEANSRILAPVVPLLVVLAVWLSGEVRARTAGRLDGGARVVAVLALAGLLGFAGWAVALAWSHGREGRGYAAPRYERSPLIRAAGAVPASALLYSNDPLAIAAVTERQPVRLLLAPGQPDVIGRAHPTVARLEALACRRAVWVAWFGEGSEVPVSLPDAREVADGVLGRVAPDACG